ncbi:hypothetical protein [Rhizobium laguerreae]|uniref:hypothetical protein n=1 Tax=Rhizobium laguerreae TaxID=1076926 RepID=UPI0013899694|nr:hypothetical protein [Rhizobium laguerreae]NDK52810.1 hypothetical protein [Rhizobium laguerreae]
MKRSMLLMLAVVLAVVGTGPRLYAFEIETFQSKVYIPAGKVVNLDAPANVNVDQFRLDGELITSGKLLKITASTISVGSSGVLTGYPTGDTAARPPKKASFQTAAASGVVPPNQLSGAWYLGGTAEGGANGTAGDRGDPGITGEENPEPIFLTATDLILDGKIELFGQQGSPGGEGQNGQNGGDGARGQNAACGKGNTTCYCYSGTIKSGPGGLGGLGGRGGTGGKGGRAIPLLLLALDQTAYTRAVSSNPGQRGIGGAPGSVGQIGSIGGEGRSCSATANWGDAFCSCSMGGGKRTSQQIVDTRSPLNGGAGDDGDNGDNVDWTKIDNLLGLSHGLPSISDNVRSLSMALKGLPGQIGRDAILIEIAGRLGSTIRQIEDRLINAQDISEKRALISEAEPRLLQIATRLEQATPSAKGLHDFLNTDGADYDGYPARLALALPLLRESFTSQKNELMSRCSELKEKAVFYLGDKASSYFPREFGLCLPSNYVWIPFVLDNAAVTVGARTSEVSDAFKPYFSIETAPLPDAGKFTMNSGITIREVGKEAAEQAIESRRFLAGLTEGELAPGKLVFGGDSIGRTISEKLSRLTYDLDSLGNAPPR